MVINLAPDQAAAYILAGVGAQADAAAASDTATASLIGLIKRSLQTQTTISGKLPTLVNNTLPVTISAGASAGTCTKSTASVTATSSTALAANANRKRALLLNPPSATNTIILGFTATAVAASDVPLSPGMGWLEAFDMIHTGVFSSIVSSGTASLLVFEWV